MGDSLQDSWHKIPVCLQNGSVYQKFTADVSDNCLSCPLTFRCWMILAKSCLFFHTLIVWHSDFYSVLIVFNLLIVVNCLHQPKQTLKHLRKRMHVIVCDALDENHHVLCIYRLSHWFSGRISWAANDAVRKEEHHHHRILCEKVLHHFFIESVFVQSQ